MTSIVDMRLVRCTDSFDIRRGAEIDGPLQENTGIPKQSTRRETLQTIPVVQSSYIRMLGMITWLILTYGDV